MAYADTSAIQKTRFKIGEAQLDSNNQTIIKLGFKPIMLCIYSADNIANPVRLFMYDERYKTSSFRVVYTDTYSKDVNFFTTNINVLYSISNDGFVMNKGTHTFRYFAIGENVNSSLRKYAFGSGTFSTTAQTKVVCGFKPKQVLLFRDNNALAMYDERYATTKVKYGTPSAYLQDQNLGVTTNGRLTSIDDDGFTFNKDVSAYPYLWFALG